jgi:hypothetical protein
MTRGKVEAGVCGFKTEIEATTEEDGQTVALAINTDCDNMRRFAEKLDTVDAYAELGARFDGRVYQAARETHQGCCAGCAAVVGVLKTIQVAARLALPQTATITVANE